MRSALLVLLVFLVLALSLTWPLAQHAASAVEDVHDALLNTWILAWDGHALLSDPLHLFDANIFYPYHNTLAFSEIMLPHALLALPFSLASDNPILGYNLALILSFVISGFACYLLVLRTTGSRLAGLAAGIVFAFNAYKLSNLAQVQLLTLEWLPLALLYLERIFGPGQRARMRDVLLLALFVVLQALSSFYYAILSGLAIVLWLLVTAVVRRSTLGWGSLARAAGGLIAGALLVTPFIAPYLQVEHELGFKRAISESIPFSASLAQYAHAVPGNVLYGAILPASSVVIGGYALDSLFPGVGALALAVVGFVAWRRRSRAWLFPVLLLLACAVLSLGPALTLSPGRTIALPFAMPYELLYAIPGMQAMRAPVRFAALVFLALSILVGLGVAAVAGRPGRIWERALRSTVAALCIAFLVAEVVTVPAARTVPVASGSATPPVYRWLAAQPHGVVLELPMLASGAERGLLNQYYSAYHWQTTPDGYSGFIPPKHGEVEYEMQSFPSERSVAMLQGLDVRYLVVHTELVPDWAARQSRLGDFPVLVLAQRFGDTVVYGISAANQEAPLHASVYFPSAVQAGSVYTASLILTNDALHSAVTHPTSEARVQAIWKTEANAVIKTQDVSLSLPIVISEAGVVPIVLQPPTAGAYRLSLKIHLPQGADVAADGVVSVAPKALPQAEVIPARLVAGAAEKERYRPGDTVNVKLRWRALGKIDAYYSVFVRLLDKNGQAIVQKDGQPSGGAEPTLLWIPGQEIADNWQLAIPANATPGLYLLEAGIYRPQDLSPRLTIDNAGQPIERLPLGSLRIAPTLEIAGAPSLPITAALGDKITLIGYDIDGCAWQEKLCQIRAGVAVSVTLYWRAEKAMAADYSVFVHLAGPDGKPAAQHDGQPRAGTYPTSVWQKGDVVADQHVFVVPATLPPGQYRILAGMYELPGAARLPTGTTGDSIALVEVIVR